MSISFNNPVGSAGGIELSSVGTGAKSPLPKGVSSPNPNPHQEPSWMQNQSKNVAIGGFQGRKGEVEEGGAAPAKKSISMEDQINSGRSSSANTPVNVRMSSESSRMEFIGDQGAAGLRAGVKGMSMHGLPGVVVGAVFALGAMIVATGVVAVDLAMTAVKSVVGGGKSTTVIDRYKDGQNKILDGLKLGEQKTTTKEQLHHDKALKTSVFGEENVKPKKKTSEATQRRQNEKVRQNNPFSPEAIAAAKAKNKKP
ncbi:MAG: hypothetical protein V4489_05790 [Chlamydiota bacterium]